MALGTSRPVTNPLAPSVAIIGSRGYLSTYGGFETFVRHLAPHLRDAGAAVTVYGHAPHGRQEVLHDGIRRVETLGINTKATATLTHGMTAVFDACRRNFDVVLLLNIANGFYIPLLQAAGIPVAVNVDGLEWERGKWGYFPRQVFRAGARITARRADVVIADSRAISDVWRDTFQRDCVFLPYGGDVVADVPLEPVREVGLKPGYILLVARLVPENNIDLFLDAVELMHHKPPVVVVGSANYKSPIVDRLTKLSNTVRWLGHIADQALLASLWAHCGVYFHGHSVGGTNPALLQAMGLGAPVIAVDSPYSREVLSNAEALVEARPESVATRLGEVLESDVVRNELRRRGTSRVRSAYRWSDVCNGYWEVLRDLSDRSSRGFPLRMRGRK